MFEKLILLPALRSIKATSIKTLELTSEKLHFTEAKEKEREREREGEKEKEREREKAEERVSGRSHSRISHLSDLNISTDLEIPLHLDQVPGDFTRNRK